MWIFAKKGFVSIFAHREKPDTLLVRARFKGDIQKLFPKTKGIKRTPCADYPYRVALSRSDVAVALAAHIVAIDYPNFKDAVPKGRTRTYERVWSIMANAGDNYLPPRRSKAASPPLLFPDDDFEDPPF